MISVSIRVKICPNNYPQLKFIVWNRNPADLIEEEEAFALYERNWRHIEVAALTDDEKKLIELLTEKFGHGVLNV